MTASLAELTAGMSMDQRAALAARVRAKAARLRTVRECPTTLDLMARYAPDTVRTPALELISTKLRETVDAHSGRVVIAMPPQEGKTQSLQWLCVWLLISDPTRRIAYASYSAFLARQSGRAVRALIETFGDQFGLAVSQDQADASSWRLDGFRGGMRSVGVGGSLTGVPANVLVVDDSLRGRKDANSETIRATLHEWWRTTSRTRLSPGAPVIVVGTRWHEDDLSGRLVEDNGWPMVNIPALADGKTEDALDRAPGEWLESAQGRTIKDWEETRSDVGESGFAALYQGRPAPLEGGLFKREWFDRDRVTQRPDGPRAPLIVVDPADNTGGGDEAGIGVASVGHDRRIYLGPDYSGIYTAARWARLAHLACVRHKAAGVAYERSLSGVKKIVQDAWNRLWKQARVLRRLNPDVWPPVPNDEALAAAVGELTHQDDPANTRAEIRAELIEMWPLVPGILNMPSTGPRVQILHARMAKKLRAEAVQSVYENRRVSHVGDMRQAEHEMATWQVGMPSPNRMDWVTYAIDVMDGGSAFGSLSRTSERVPTSSTGMRSRPSTRLTRSTRR